MLDQFMSKERETKSQSYTVFLDNKYLSWAFCTLKNNSIQSPHAVILAEELLELKKETIIHSICCLAEKFQIDP